jgi:hypothetical protein
MIREGQPEVTLRYISESPKRLAISSFTEGERGLLSALHDFLTRDRSDPGPQHSEILGVPLGTSASLQRYEDGLC